MENAETESTYDSLKSLNKDRRRHSSRHHHHHTQQAHQAQQKVTLSPNYFCRPAEKFYSKTLVFPNPIPHNNRGKPMGLLASRGLRESVAVATQVLNPSAIGCALKSSGFKNVGFRYDSDNEFDDSDRKRLFGRRRRIKWGTITFYALSIGFVLLMMTGVVLAIGYMQTERQRASSQKLFQEYRINVTTATPPVSTLPNYQNKNGPSNFFGTSALHPLPQETPKAPSDATFSAGMLPKFRNRAARKFGLYSQEADYTTEVSDKLEISTTQPFNQEPQPVLRLTEHVRSNAESETTTVTTTRESLKQGNAQSNQQFHPQQRYSDESLDEQTNNSLGQLQDHDKSQVKVHPHEQQLSSTQSRIPPSFTSSFVAVNNRTPDATYGLSLKPHNTENTSQDFATLIHPLHPLLSPSSYSIPILVNRGPVSTEPSINIRPTTRHYDETTTQKPMKTMPAESSRNLRPKQTKHQPALTPTMFDLPKSWVHPIERANTTAFLSNNKPVILEDTPSNDIAQSRQDSEPLSAHQTSERLSDRQDSEPLSAQLQTEMFEDEEDNSSHERDSEEDFHRQMSNNYRNGHHHSQGPLDESGPYSQQRPGQNPRYPDRSSRPFSAKSPYDRGSPSNEYPSNTNEVRVLPPSYNSDEHPRPQFSRERHEEQFKSLKNPGPYFSPEYDEPNRINPPEFRHQNQAPERPQGSPPDYRYHQFEHQQPNNNRNEHNPNSNEGRPEAAPAPPKPNESLPQYNFGPSQTQTENKVIGVSFPDIQTPAPIQQANNVKDANFANVVKFDPSTFDFSKLTTTETPQLAQTTTSSPLLNFDFSSLASAPQPSATPNSQVPAPSLNQDPVNSDSLSKRTYNFDFDLNNFGQQQSAASTNTNPFAYLLGNQGSVTGVIGSASSTGANLGYSAANNFNFDFKNYDLGQSASNKFEIPSGTIPIDLSRSYIPVNGYSVPQQQNSFDSGSNSGGQYDFSASNPTFSFNSGGGQTSNFGNQPTPDYNTITQGMHLLSLLSGNIPEHLLDTPSSSSNFQFQETKPDYQFGGSTTSYNSASSSNPYLVSNLPTYTNVESGDLNGGTSTNGQTVNSYSVTQPQVLADQQTSFSETIATRTADLSKIFKKDEIPGTKHSQPSETKILSPVGFKFDLIRVSKERKNKLTEKAMIESKLDTKPGDSMSDMMSSGSDHIPVIHSENFEQNNAKKIVFNSRPGNNATPRVKTAKGLRSGFYG